MSHHAPSAPTPQPAHRAAGDQVAEQTRASEQTLRDSTRGRDFPAPPPTAAPRHRLADISFAPIQRCGCHKHYESPRRLQDAD
ncbi:MAG: hypothetical protein AAGM22_27030 [Acidobacteriota bacterium]